MKCWEQTTLRYYYEGLAYGDYPGLIMERILPQMQNCHSLLDICSGPGAFSLYSLKQGWRTTAIDLAEIALEALEEKAKNYPQSRFQAIYGDFLTTAVPHADIAVAACCFYEQMATPAALEKIIDSTNQVALFVQHGEPAQPEFLTAGLPVDAEKKPLRWQNYPLAEVLNDLAAARGLTLNSDSLECDFGCLYSPDDARLLDFISRKTGVSDLPLLQQHLHTVAQPRAGRLWLPNPRRFVFFWINKKATN